MINEIITIGNTYQTDNKVLELISRVFIELAESYYITISFYEEFLSNFSFSMINSNDERLCLMGFEYWCRLGSEELSRFKSDKEKNTKTCQYYYQKYFSKLKEVVDRFIVLPNDREDLEDDWNYSKASCYILVLMVQVCNMTSVEEIIQEIKGKYKFF